LVTLAAWRAGTTMEGFLKKDRFSFLPAAFLAVIMLSVGLECATAQEVGLVPLDMNEVAKGYRAEQLKLKPVVNDKGETIGTIRDFIFGKDGKIFAVLAVGDFTGFSGQMIAVSFLSLNLDDPRGYIVLPGASRTALEKLPVFRYNQ
jgi:PRC-barrel domain